MKEGIEKINKTTFYKTNPRGISLIVLVITIIVIIILATAIIVSIVNNNPISEANKARYESDRDNMQSIFTNTLAKVMADKKASIGVIAGELNAVKSEVDKTVGEAAYTINGEVVGSIIFDDRENTDNDYYTGRQLPIYKKETTWHVDSEGILRLQVGDKTYGEGIIEGETLNQEIKISHTVTTSSDFTKATLGIVIEYEGEISSVTINGESVEVVKNSEGKYVVSKEVRDNGNYSVVVRAKDGSVNKEIVKVEDLTEDMEIWNRADMELFRDKVNSGRTFEGRKAIVMDDIDLGGSNNNWTPVANYGINNNLIFKGTFEGNGKTISNLYINNSNSFQGLFGYSIGEIKNINISGIITNCGNYSGGIIGNNGGNIVNCHNSVIISSNSESIGGISGYSSNNSKIEKCSNLVDLKASYNAGGIVGNLVNGAINSCCNIGNITATIQVAGGIIGHAVSGNLYNSYNTGSIYSPKFVGGINGAGGHTNTPTMYTYNCYNIGSVTGNNTVGNITGYSNANGGSSLDINCYSTNVTVELLNAGAYSENAWKEDKEVKINNGYPILNWQ